MSYYDMLYHIIPCYAMYCHVMLHHIIPCYTMLYYVMLYHIIPCYTMSCHIPLFYPMFSSSIRWLIICFSSSNWSKSATPPSPPLPLKQPKKTIGPHGKKQATTLTRTKVIGWQCSTLTMTSQSAAAKIPIMAWMKMSVRCWRQRWTERQRTWSSHRGCDLIGWWRGWDDVIGCWRGVGMTWLVGIQYGLDVIGWNSIWAGIQNSKWAYLIALNSKWDDWDDYHWLELVLRCFDWLELKMDWSDWWVDFDACGLCCDKRVAGKERVGEGGCDWAKEEEERGDGCVREGKRVIWGNMGEYRVMM